MRDEDSVANNGLTEIKIVDNQIMNFNNRSDYLEGILNALDGLYYYINDFNSTGILYYEVGDLYNVQIKENTYQCLMLNDEVNVTTGIEEIIYTDIPEKSETDYSKADKTDMKINKTYIIVDKQNQTIESVVNNVTEQNNKISQITQTVDEINSKVQDIADITTYGESDKAEVELTDINESEPIMIKVHPTSTNISYLYPSENLYPSDTQFMRDRIIRFTRTYEEEGQTLTENIDYTLPNDLLRYSNTVYDEFYLDYDSQTCQIIKRCAYNADGTVRALGTEITTDYPYPIIALGEGNYTITLLGYDFGYIYARLMAKNIYTTQFYTKAETESRINQKANEINLGVNQTLTNYSTTNEMNSAIILKANEITNSVSATYSTKTELGTVERNLTASLELKINTDDLISEINASADKITLTSGRLIISSGNFQLNAAGNITCTGGTIGGWTIGTNAIYKNYTSGGSTYQSGMYTSDSATAFLYAGAPLGGYLSESNLQLLRDGKIIIRGYGTTTDLFRVEATDSNGFTYIQPRGMGIVGSSTYRIDLIADSGDSVIYVDGRGSSTTIRYNGIVTPSVTQTSREQNKKNFEKLQNGLDIVNSIDIYKYNLITEKDNFKKHIGFVIGKEFNYSSEITTIDQNGEEIGVDTYSMVAVGYKAIQELHQEIQELKERIK